METLERVQRIWRNITMLKLDRWPVLVLLLLSFGSVFAQTPVAHHPFTFRVTLAPSTGTQDVSGRLIVILSSKPPSHGDMYDPQSPDAAFMWMAAQEVQHLRAGSSVDVDADQVAFPEPFSQLSAGDYYATALLDVDHNAGYRFLSPGDIYAKPVPVKGFDPTNDPPIQVTLTEHVPQWKQPELPANAERLDFESLSLSKFWGRPIHMRGVVLLPPNYGKTLTKYPTVYWMHGYGADEYTDRVHPRKALFGTPGHGQAAADDIRAAGWALRRRNTRVH
jgi:hypothetical protein